MEITKTVKSSWTTGADHYLVPSNHLIKLCGGILDNKKYVIKVEKRFEKTDAPTKSVHGTLKPTMLRIALRENSKTLALTHEERKEIELKLLFELRQQLGEADYERLFVSGGISTTDGSYCINLNRKMLYELTPTLEALAKKISSESIGEHYAREQLYKLRKEQSEIDLEINNAVSRVTETESKFGSIQQINSQEYFALLATQYAANKMALSDATARKELSSAMLDDIGIPPEIKEHIVQIYLLSMRYREAVFSDIGFQNELFRKYPEKTIEKIMEDPDRRIECFVLYIEENPPHQTALKTIFNSADPEVNKARFETYLEHSKSIATSTKSYDNIVLSGKIGDAITYCFSYIVSEEKKYTEPIGRLIDASHFHLGYSHLTYQPQFERFDPITKIVSWPLKSIKLEVVPCKHGVIRNAEDFDDYVSKLTYLLGEAKFKRLVLSTEIISSMNGDGETFCLYLDPAELQTITLDALIPDLSSTDLKMYCMMRVEKQKGDEETGKIDRVALMYKDFVAMYEIYAKFKIAPSNAKVSFASDPDFVGGSQDNGQSQWRNFIQFINGNKYYLNTIMQIFGKQNPQENRVKCDEYVQKCEMIAKYAMGDELKNTGSSLLDSLCNSVQELRLYSIGLT